MVGDSISVHYGPYLEKKLEGYFRCVQREDHAAALANLDVPLGANWGDSSMVLDRLKKTALLQIVPVDVVLVNCGLHDIKRASPTSDCQVPLNLYRDNLEAIAEYIAQARARMIWVSSTPVDDERHGLLMKEFIRLDRDGVAYNEAAREIMQRRGVPVIDLYCFVKDLGGDVYGDHVHFVESVREKQAAYIADRLIDDLNRVN